MNWNRIVAWSFWIFIAANVVAFCSGLTMTRWDIYGDTIESATRNSRLVRWTLIGTVTAVLYWRFAAGVRRRRASHVLAVFGVVLLIDIGLSVVQGTPVGELIDLSWLGRNALAALVGLGLASVGSRRSDDEKSDVSKDTPFGS